MDAEWTSLLVCPFCKGKLRFHKTEKTAEFWCLFDGMAFPCKGTTPIFLESQARTLSAEEKLSRKNRNRD